MSNWFLGFTLAAILISASATAQTAPGTVERPRVDTAAFSFSLADWHRGETVFLHAAGTTLLRFYDRNIQAVYRGDTTLVEGFVTITFYVDNTGKFTGARCENATDPQLMLEIMRVTRFLSRVSLTPTSVAGKPVASSVRMKVKFTTETADAPLKGPAADLTIHLGEPEYRRAS